MFQKTKMKPRVRKSLQKTMFLTPLSLKEGPPRILLWKKMETSFKQCGSRVTCGIGDLCPHGCRQGPVQPALGDPASAGGLD